MKFLILVSILVVPAFAWAGCNPGNAPECVSRCAVYGSVYDLEPVGLAAAEARLILDARCINDQKVLPSDVECVATPYYDDLSSWAMCTFVGIPLFGTPTMLGGLWFQRYNP